VSLVYLRDKGADRVDLGDCDLVVLGGPIYAGSWSKKAAAFARARERDLAEKTFAYFCSGMGVEEGTAAVAAALPQSLAAKASRRPSLAGRSAGTG
jgi:menaquinone-dependent protoporphyrinogen IX oxidase